jgi:hypothetical protein
MSTFTSTPPLAFRGDNDNVSEIIAREEIEN